MFMSRRKRRILPSFPETISDCDSQYLLTTERLETLKDGGGVLQDLNDVAQMHSLLSDLGCRVYAKIGTFMKLRLLPRAVFVVNLPVILMFSSL